MLISKARQKYSDFDCAIRFGSQQDAQEAGAEGEWLCHETLVLMGSPLLMLDGIWPDISLMPQLHLLNGDRRLDNWSRC